MNNWILILPMAAFAILAVAGWLAAYSTHRELLIARKVSKKLVTANQQLYAEDADLREEVQERRAECISLKLQLEEALSTSTKPMSKARSVRVRKVEDEQP